MPTAVLMYVLYAWIANQNNIQDSYKWFVMLSLLGAFPLWSFVSRVSKNIAIDGIIYNFILFTSETLALIYFSGMKPSFVQWTGIGLSIVGLLLITK